MFFCKNRASGDNFQDLKSTTNESYNAAAAIEGLERMPDAFRGMIEQTKFVRTSLNWTLTHLRHMYMCPGAAIEYYGNIDIAICEMAHIPLERILSEKVRLAKHEIYLLKRVCEVGDILDRFGEMEYLERWDVAVDSIENLSSQLDTEYLISTRIVEVIRELAEALLGW